MKKNEIEKDKIKEEYRQLCVPGEDSRKSLARLEAIIDILRAECPWDKVQTHESLRPGMIEEAYETVEAINNNDKENLREELGDVLLQVVFHSHLAAEENNFNLTDVINEECEKMIRRHPHIFLQKTGNNNTKSIDKILEKWENIKEQEKGEKKASSIMKEVPKSLPSLMRACAVQKKAAHVGFDWDDISGAFDKVYEELTELKSQYDEDSSCRPRLEEELGDLLFSCVNVARFLGIDPETSLNYTIGKFLSRFSYVEDKAESLGRKMNEMSLPELDCLWEEAKRLEHTL